ncbi:MAG: SIR2 family protein [Anaerovoracaceae bacterium]|jgi:hypothetical protein
MNMDRFGEIVEEINKNLGCTNQNWLFGAGISHNANVPLMISLTERVAAMLPEDETKSIYEGITEDLHNNFHIEHVLSHLGDHIAIAERSKHQKTTINGNSYEAIKLRKLHSTIIESIGETVRYGYRKFNIDGEDSEEIGSMNKPIIKIDDHLSFAETLLETHANLLKRSSITIFTTNYDTLIEDAFSLINVEVNDGFVGAAIGFWKPELSYKKQTGINVVKLHGSVDWISDEHKGLLRTRYGTNYNLSNSEVLIYPQATKYVETQKDPFANLFTEFRQKINSKEDNVLIVCGYSFGDEHINTEIYQALSQENNKTTLIVFAKEKNAFLEKLLDKNQFGNKVYIASSKGIYHGDNSLISRIDGESYDWWKFEGMISFLKDGEI